MAKGRIDYAMPDLKFGADVYDFIEPGDRLEVFSFYLNASCHKLMNDVEKLNEMAADGDPLAMYLLGIDASHTNNKQLAIEWFQKAAEAGFVYAQYLMGYFSASIEGDMSQAKYWHKLAADNGCISSKLSLAYLLAKECDYLEAVRYVDELANTLEKDIRYELSHILGEIYFGNDILNRYLNMPIDEFKSKLNLTENSSDFLWAQAYCIGPKGIRNHKKALKLAERISGYKDEFKDNPTDSDCILGVHLLSYFYLLGVGTHISIKKVQDLLNMYRDKCKRDQFYGFINPDLCEKLGGYRGPDGFVDNFNRIVTSGKEGEEISKLGTVVANKCVVGLINVMPFWAMIVIGILFEMFAVLLLAMNASLVAGLVILFIAAVIIGSGAFMLNQIKKDNAHVNNSWQTLILRHRERLIILYKNVFSVPLKDIVEVYYKQDMFRNLGEIEGIVCIKTKYTTFNIYHVNNPKFVINNITRMVLRG